MLSIEIANVGWHEIETAWPATVNVLHHLLQYPISLQDRHDEPSLVAKNEPSPNVSGTGYLNVRNVETFYHVVCNGGINRAASKMPYPIQQPAISEQIRQLEEAAGQKLFCRKPFRLIDGGKEIHSLAGPFFTALTELIAKLRRGSRPRVRIAAQEVLIRHYLSRIVWVMLKYEPALQITFRSGSGDEMKRWLIEGEVDVVITSLSERVPHTLAYQLIVELPLVLIVAKSTGIRSADHLWNPNGMAYPLVCPAPDESISRVFHRGLKRGGIDWPVSVVTSSVASVSELVAFGSGIGVTLDLPCLVNGPGIRVLPLNGFDPVQIAMFWRRADASRLKASLGLLSAEAKARFGCTQHYGRKRHRDTSSVSLGAGRQTGKSRLADNRPDYGTSRHKARS